ncbi:HD-GYP domain-containing protein [Halodesulfovibrio spirochaetisodalis]|uniref:HD family phosphohydrolase n=1 Tax=Halodesulfovibrio spirochaetisodalis TaxID=1560234 RepID=A0A1B7XL29_9BACT|nr:HD domain-containing phosphohydrolase [Halodesulfovibrio spirochaetisodalis]OBQ56212.1 HD family phosphohydrolase [Halodesulfovibrio spirochaetisodalis]
MTTDHSAASESFREAYYQIAKSILESFPKYRPPLDLFVYKDESATLETFCRKGQRLSNEEVDEVHSLCSAGSLFVARADHAVYFKHIIKQLDLVLIDENLKQTEIAEVIIQALIVRLEDFINQPVRPVFEELYKDVMVLTEFLAQDRFRIKLFMRRLAVDEHKLSAHSLNTAISGLWLFFETRKDFKRRDLDKATLAFMLHDIGMSKVPSFILDKTEPLKRDERAKIIEHALQGGKVMHKLGFAFDEMVQAIMQHHERLDGSGYPNKLKGDDIGWFGRMTAVADSFSAMITPRKYAEALPPAEAALALQNDEKRYDVKYTSLLNAAYVTNQF